MSTTTCQSSGPLADYIANAVQAISILQCAVPAAVNYPTSATIADGSSYDMIIVGAGVAGSVLANRLSEVSEWNILLLEAGDNPTSACEVPQLSNTLRNSPQDWNFTTVNDGVSAQALANGCIGLGSGKMTGGSSSYNPIFYDECSKSDTQTWYDQGNKQWTPEKSAKYFKMMTNLKDVSLLKDSKIDEYYGHDGLITVSTSKFTYDDMMNNIVDAFDEMGIPKQVDLNYANNLGAGRHRTIDLNGVRNNMAKFYLNPIAESRSNLKIVTNALVRKVIIDSDLKATGVEVDVGGTVMTITATKEVIVSAGAIKSPQLLMLSGIGSCEHLKSVGVTPLVESPMVGQNFKTHSYLPILIAADEPGPLTEADQNMYAIEYLFKQSGYFGQPIQADATAFFSKDSTATVPDYQAHLVVHYKNSSTIEQRIASRFVDSESSNIMAQTDGRAVLEFSLQVLDPESSGYIELASTDPEQNPLIYWNNFACSTDLESAATGCQMVTKILETTYFKSINATLVTMDYCKEYEADSTDYWKCVGYNMSTSLFHPVSTCRMGTDITTSVVDGCLKVHGVEGLRVIDASVMASTPHGNTFAPTAMVAETAADLIKTSYDQTTYIHITE